MKNQEEIRELIGIMALLKEEISLFHLKKILNKNISKNFEHIRQACLEIKKKKVKYYKYDHDRFNEFILTNSKVKELRPTSAEILEIHKKICDYISKDYKKNVWKKKYNYRHLTEHYYIIWQLTGNGNDAQKLFSTVSDDRRWEKRKALGNDSSFKKNDLEYAIKTSKELGQEGIFYLIKYCYINSLLNSIRCNVSTELIESLLEMGQTKRARGIVSIFNGEKKIEGLIALYNFFNKKSKNKKCKKVLDEILEVLQTFERDSLKSECLFKIIQALAKTDKIDEQKVYFDKLINLAKGLDEKNKLEILGNIAVLLIKYGNIKVSSEIAKDLMEANSEFQIILVKATELACSKKFDEALKQAYSIENLQIRSKTLGLIAEEYAKAQYFNEALELIQNIQDHYYNTRALSKIADVLAVSNYDNEDYFDQILKFIKKMNANRETLYSLGNIAIALAGKGNFDKALKTAEDIDNLYYKPIVLEKIAVELAKKQKFDQALSLITNIKDSVRKSAALGKIASELSKIDSDKAKNYIEEAIESVEGLDETYETASFFARIALILADVNALKQSFNIIQNIKEEFSKSEALEKIAIKLAYLNNFKKAIVLTERIKRACNKKNALESIALRMIELKNLDEAKICIDNILKIGGEFEFNVTLRNITLQLAKFQNFDLALDLIKHIDDVKYKKYKLEILLLVADGFYEANEKKEGIKYINESIAMAEHMENKTDQLESFMSIAIQLRKLKNLELAQKYFNKVLSIIEEFEKTEYDKYETISYSIQRVISELVEANFFNEAVIIADKIENSERRAKVSAPGEIAQGLNKIKDFDKFIKISQKFQKYKIKSSTLTEIVLELADFQNSGSFKKAISLAQNIKNIQERKQTLEEIKITLSNYRNLTKILKLNKSQEFGKAIQLINRVDEDDMLSAFENIIEAIAKTNNFDIIDKYIEKIIEMIQNLDDIWDQKILLPGIIQELAKTKDFDKITKYIKKTIEIAKKIENGEEILGEIAAILTKYKNFPVAFSIVQDIYLYVKELNKKIFFKFMDHYVKSLPRKPEDFCYNIYKAIQKSENYIFKKSTADKVKHQ